MAKQKIEYVCTECGGVSLKWVGKCPECGQWNTMVEHMVESKSSNTNRGVSVEKIARLKDVKNDVNIRTLTKISELDRVLGGGVVEGAITLIGGDPGIGKSTLLLQVAGLMSKQGVEILYVSGEESVDQVAMRAKRLNVSDSTLHLYCQTNVDKILKAAADTKAKVMIVDSIQTMYKEELPSAPGSVAQVRESSASFLRYAKENGCAIFLVGHVTKQGSIAGPRILEHMVDTVLYFEGNSDHSYRILRAVKNRFGSTNEIGVFEMTEAGMTEVKNPSQMLMSQKSEGFPGSVVTVTMEGTRAILVEVQALVSQTAFGMPRRQSSGMDYNRVVLLLAVLEKRAGIKLYDQDCYINIAGGMKIVEPSADLALCIAVASAVKNKMVPEDTVVFGEVGLTGEVRGTSSIQQRINEAVRSGFKTIIIPGKSSKGLKAAENVELIPVERLPQAIKAIWG
ncbi:MAG: DNA repair protein RadA [Eubacteriales bacterium]